jgi:hypothetical protein
MDIYITIVSIFLPLGFASGLTTCLVILGAQAIKRSLVSAS